MKLQTLYELEKFNIDKMTLPESLKPKKLKYATNTNESISFMNYISSQHPLINVWLVFSFVSIGIFSALLFII